MLAVEGEQCLDRNSEIIRALLAASLAIEKKKDSAVAPAQ